MLQYVLVTGHLQDQADFTYHLVFVVGAAGGMLFLNETFHKVLALLSAVVYALYIAMLFTALR